MKAECLFDGAHIRADLFNGSAPRLFVSFRQRIETPGHFDLARPVRSFVDHGYAHLHLQSLQNDWYINKDTNALEAALEKHCDRYDHACSMGFSMGGYGAMRFAQALRLREVVLISPQVSIHPDVVPWDRRYRAHAGGFKRILGDLGFYGAAGLQGFALFDPFRKLDLRNVDAIHSLFPGILPCRMAGGGHPATQAMRGSGGMGALQEGLREGTLTRRRVVDLHRNARAEAGYYWDRLSERAARHNRPALAQRAIAKANALAPAHKG